MNDDNNIETSKLTDADRELAGLKVNRASLQRSLQQVEGRAPRPARVVAGEQRSLQEIEGRMRELDPASLEDKPAAQ